MNASFVCAPGISWDSVHVHVRAINFVIHVCKLGLNYMYLIQNCISRQIANSFSLINSLNTTPPHNSHTHGATNPVCFHVSSSSTVIREPPDEVVGVVWG